MLYLRPALKYFCSPPPLHEDLIYDTDPSFVNKVEKEFITKTQRDFSLIIFVFFRKCLFLPPLALSAAICIPSPSLVVGDGPPRVSTFEIRFVTSSCQEYGADHEYRHDPPALLRIMPGLRKRITPLWAVWLALV